MRPKLILNSNLPKHILSLTPISVVDSFWKFTLNTAVVLSCSVQIFTTIDNWAICYAQRRFRVIWIWDAFQTNILYQPLLSPCSLRRHRLIDIGFPIINLRRTSYCLWFIMRIPMPVRRCVLVNTGQGVMKPGLPVYSGGWKTAFYIARE